MNVTDILKGLDQEQRDQVAELPRSERLGYLAALRQVSTKDLLSDLADQTGLIRRLFTKPISLVEPRTELMNLAAAVQILSYEWHVAQLDHAHPDSSLSANKSPAIAPAGEIEGFYEHLWQTLEKIDFLDEDNPVPLMRKVRRLFDRTELSSAEINILRGILKSINKSIS